MVYTTDDKIYTVQENGKSTTLADADSAGFLVSQDGKKLYFLEDEDLYLRDGTKDAEKIASDVVYFSISTDGKTVAYIKDAVSNVGDLYVKVIGKDAEKVSGDVHKHVVVSDNGKYIGYSQTDTSSMWDGDGYVYKVGSDKVKLGGVCVAAVSDNGTALAYDTSDDLYLVNWEKEKNKVAKSVESVVANQDLSKLVYITDDSDMYYYNGKDKEKLDSNVAGVVDAKGIYRANYTLNVIRVQGKAIDLTYNKNNGMYVSYDGNEGQKIVSSSYVSLNASEDFRTFIYENKGRLIKKTYNDTKLVKEEELAEDVKTYTLSTNKEHLAYYNDDEDKWFYKKVGSTKETALKDDIESIKIADNGTLYFINDSDSLYVTTNYKDHTKLRDDVIGIDMTDNGLAYYCDEDDNLYKCVNGKKEEKIDTDVLGFSMLNKIYSFEKLY